jgi:hypothetical protein
MEDKDMNEKAFGSKCPIKEASGSLGPFLENGKDGRDGKDGNPGFNGRNGRDGVDGKGLTSEQDKMLQELPTLVKQMRPFGRPLWQVLIAVLLAATIGGAAIGAAVTFIH